MLFVPRLDSVITSDAMMERVLYTQNSTITFPNPRLSLVSQSGSPAPNAGDWLSQKLTCRTNKQINVMKASQNHSVSLFCQRAAVCKLSPKSS